ncbi:hypothetical protein GOODEAATRI_019961 [Goodea atripinnis]|uniref:PID domain-containing protein n=1 Tax=Goodea atripinnis TaxID=208336 RepID=A0ABV0PQH6_9TELE
MGCVEVLQSMRALDFSTRTQVTREAIAVVCEAVPGAKGARRRKIIANHHMQSISFASGGDPVSHPALSPLCFFQLRSHSGLFSFLFSPHVLPS